jgi:dTDP-D-glucose 4,6-dehydratase
MGYEPSVDFEEGLRRTIVFYKEAKPAAQSYAHR